MAKVTVTLYIEEQDKEALQKLAEAEDRSLSQMAVLILKQKLKPAIDQGANRQIKAQVRDNATLKPPNVADLPSQYRTNAELRPKVQGRMTAAYLQTHEFQELAARIVELENVAGDVELKFKVQIELGGELQPSEETIASLNEILQQIIKDLKFSADIISR